MPPELLLNKHTHLALLIHKFLYRCYILLQKNRAYYQTGSSRKDVLSILLIKSLTSPHAADPEIW